MEECLQYMRTLRSQMNDVEDQAATVSMEEQTQITTVHTIENDLNSATTLTKQLREDTDKMLMAKGLICSQNLEKQKRIASLESEISNLTQDWLNSHKANGEVEGDGRENLMAKLDTAKAKLAKLEQMKFKLVTENKKVKELIEQVKCEVRDFKPELLTMAIKTLEDEYQALLTDKAGEFEFLQSLQDQVKKLKAISHLVKCTCGMEYKV